jgi:P pilus assembly chaperone PapD
MAAGAVMVTAAAASFTLSATGVRPETTILLISETDGLAQMVVENTDDTPSLLDVKVIDLPEDQNLSVYALPASSRIEANGRQVVRFYLQKPDKPLTVQSMKRVSFEGIPGERKLAAGIEKSRTSGVRFTIRQTIPMIISPATLKQDNEPWRFLEARVRDAEIIEVNNPSPYVVRLNSDVRIAPALKNSQLLKRTYILPGETFSLSYAGIATAETLTVMRIYPASPWGLAAPPYDIRITR